MDAVLQASTSGNVSLHYESKILAILVKTVTNVTKIWDIKTD